MSRATVTQQGVEVFHQIPNNKALVTQYGIEVFHEQAVSWDPVATESGSSASLGAYGDECDTTTIDAAWTLRNIASVSGDGSQYPIYMDAAGDAITRSFTDSGYETTNASICAHITGITDAQGMYAICALDASGNGVGFARYNNGWTSVIKVVSWAFDNWWGNAGTCALGDHWLHLQRYPNGIWSGRFSDDGTTWSSFAGTPIDTRTITQIGVVRLYSGAAQTINLERFISPVDFSDLDGVAVTQYGVEVFHEAPSNAVVTQYGVEVFYTTPEDGGMESGGGGGEHSFPFVS